MLVFPLATGKKTQMRDGTWLTGEEEIHFHLSSSLSPLE